MCDTCGGHGNHGEHAAPSGPGRRIVVTGKGGVGKSTLTAMLARLFARDGRGVIAIDADEQRNLGATLGVADDVLANAVPVSTAGDYIEEKVGARPGEGAGVMLRLNPDTSDVVDRLAIDGPDGVRLLIMGGVARAGGGCLCPENAVLAATIAGMRLFENDVVVMDTHAGVEHFGRALARGFDSAVVVVEPTYNSVQVGVETARLARELGIGGIHLVINRARDDADRERVARYLDRWGGFDFDSVHTVPYDEQVTECEPSVEAVLDGSPVAHAVGHLAEHLLTADPVMADSVAVGVS